ncbi:hypothetical protein CAPTEDRAFT_169940 [Capitella teleta]|uniref:Ammonium transporter AmtB-like domain-containing protein n=1 Tax=Capitella teleta TaxID=283909 RepID=R7UTF2_CAPTE|nr:hypothetical protein CAPTEDRAFT_169940 [Capitella teleta]|eukprot:ELU09794.1 hypothetical protein CAPTEDRAFT_169940 [Capitella teleta]
MPSVSDVTSGIEDNFWEAAFETNCSTFRISCSSSSSLHCSWGSLTNNLSTTFQDQCFVSRGQTNVSSSGLGTDDKLTGRDASWILTSAVIIFTMQTGKFYFFQLFIWRFGLLEAGCVSPKSETNIMVKNALDVVFGGIMYWSVGFALSFGKGKGSNFFVGTGNYFVQIDDGEDIGFIYALFLFQLSFATTSTTIVSGAMAERTKLLAYNIFSMTNTLIYSVAAHWVWAENGFLHNWGAIDVAGCGPVHLVGGMTGLVAAIILGPRASAKHSQGGTKETLPSPLKAILGMFMLWWGWLRFNSGSVFIVSSSNEWKKAVRAAVNTIVASMGGGVTAVLVGKCTHQGRYDIGTIINGVLGSLVSVTAICTICAPYEAFVVGCIGALLTIAAEWVVRKLKIDDPVGVIPVHLVCAVWGLISVGLLVPEDESLVEGQAGLLKGGQWYLLGVQALSVVLIGSWTLVTSGVSLKVLDLTIGLRLTPEEEERGADIVEHGTTIRPDDLAFHLNNMNHMNSQEEMSIGETSLSNGISTEDIRKHVFRIKAQEMFKELLTSCQRNDLQVIINSSSLQSICLEFRVLPTSSSDDSGVGLHM